MRFAWALGVAIAGISACDRFDAPRAAPAPPPPSDAGPEAAPDASDGAPRDPTATLLVDDPTSTTMTSLRGTKESLFWIAGGVRLKRTEKATGGVTTVLESKSAGPHGGGIPSITTDAASAYAIVYGLGADPFCRNAMVVDASGKARDLGYGCGGAGGTSVRDGRLYFGNWSEGDGGTSARVLEIDTVANGERAAPIDAAVAETCTTRDRVYYASRERAALHFVELAAFSGGKPFAGAFGTVSSLACDDEGLVWTTASGRLLALPHATPEKEPVILASGLDDPHAVVLASGEIFFATANVERGQHFLAAMPRSGGTPRIVWRAPDRIDSFVVDDSAIFAATAPRTIFRLDR